MKDVVIVDAVRSPIGKRNGGLAHKHSTELLGDVVRALLQRNHVSGQEVDHVVGGCVTQVGMQSSNVVRNAWLAAGLPFEVPAVTLTAQCGSAQEANSLAHALLASGNGDVAVACGVENMSAVGFRLAVPSDGSAGRPRDERYTDLWELTTQYEAADRIAENWGVDRDELDAFGKLSQDRAAYAWNQGRFGSQVVPIEVPDIDDRGQVVGSRLVQRDECMRPTEIDAIAQLRVNQPNRLPIGRHTAATSSQISDGASALLLMTEERAQALGLRPRARIVESVLVGSDPVLMLTGPLPATEELLSRSSLNLDEIDLFEINEAFAGVVLAWTRVFGVDLAKVNVNGGAIALGHPLGATGGILLTKMLFELERTGGCYGLVSMCCGGGLGTGTIIERLS